MANKHRYVRECGKCFAWARSTFPDEEKIFRTCSECGEGMCLIQGRVVEDFPACAIGKEVDINLCLPVKPPPI